MLYNAVKIKVNKDQGGIIKQQDLPMGITMSKVFRQSWKKTSGMWTVSETRFSMHYVTEVF